MAKKYNLTGIRGDTRTFEINVPDIDLTGYAFRLTVKEIDDMSTNDTNALLAKSWNTIVTINQTSIILTPADTAFDEGTYKYDVQMTSPQNNVYTLVYGDWNQVNDTTKTTP